MTNIKNSLVETINNHIKFRQEFFALQDRFERENNEFQAKINSFVERTLEEFSLEENVKIYFTFYSDKDDPHFLIYDIKDYTKGYEANYWLNIDGKWIKYKGSPSNNSIYFHKLDLKADINKVINLDHLKEACDIITEKTGLRVDIKQYSIVNSKDIEIPKNIDDLLVKHTGATIVVNGNIWHVGWDVPDYWAIVRTRKGHIIVYYSTNGHGFGYDTVIMPEDKTNKFLDLLDEENKAKIPADIFKKLKARY